MFSSEEAKIKFLAHPETYISNKQAPTNPPPIRFLVVGTIGNHRFSHVNNQNFL